MASPSSLTEPVKIRSTATTTLWELVSPIDSCKCCIVLESIRPPRAITTCHNTINITLVNHTNVGDQLFQLPLATACVWNSLLEHVNSSPNVAVFQSHLRTRLFPIIFLVNTVPVQRRTVSNTRISW